MYFGVMFEELYEAFRLKFMKRHGKSRQLHAVFAAKVGAIPYKSGIMTKLDVSLVHGQIYVNKCKL